MKWRQMGYRVALWRDRPCPVVGLCDWLRVPVNGPYPGYAVAINTLIREIIAEDSTAEWFVCGGDDVLPDPTHPAEEIAAQLRLHFVEYHSEAAFRTRAITCVDQIASSTFGVMQPTGDRFALGQIDRIAGSAWIGREFAKRAYGGRGPMFSGCKCWSCNGRFYSAGNLCSLCEGAGDIPGYRHMWVDEELKQVAEKFGVYLMRPDLIQKHMHWQRESDAIDSNAIHKPDTARPVHMHPSNNDGYTREHWRKYEKIFKARRDATPSFPGCELL